MILPAWKVVQEAFAAWAGSAAYSGFTPLPVEEVPVGNYLQTVIGLFVSYYARAGIRIDDNETFGHEAMCMVLDLIERRDMPAEVRRRALELGIPPCAKHDAGRDGREAI